jgi:hypothetical protein
MLAFDAFWRLDTRHIHSTNDVLMVLLTKTAIAEAIKDYRPIELIAKVLVASSLPKSW